MGALTWPRCQGSSWKCLGTSSVHPTHPVLLTWEVTLGPGHEGDARLGSGFKVAAETSGSGTEACGEAVVCPEDPGGGEGRWGDGAFIDTVDLVTWSGGGGGLLHRSPCPTP